MRLLMHSGVLKAVGLALLLGGAAMAPALTALAPAAHAATVRPAVGKPLQQAIALANSGKGSAAMAKVHEAEAVSGLTAPERAAISQTQNYIAATTGAGGSALGWKAKFATDYH